MSVTDPVPAGRAAPSLPEGPTAAAQSGAPSRSRRTSDYGTRRGGSKPISPGLADPAWTRLAVAGTVPVLLAATAPLPTWTRLALVVILIPLTAQGWPALLRARHDPGSTAVITLTGVTASVVVAVREDFGSAGVVMALSVLAAFVAQMVRRDGRPDLVEDLSSTVSGNLVVVLGAGWCALEPGVADPSVMVPLALALLVGALLTTLDVSASTLEALTITVPPLVAGVAGAVLAAVGFFGPSHVGAVVALQSGAACLLAGFVAGVLMSAGNRVLWTHRWVPGGRAAITSALVPVLAVGGPVYAIARLMGTFLAG
ncbi:MULTISPECIES: tellurium resistance protein TerC [Actinomyces]|uniref:tellurium resistance protein TerC n=1 Tax=Actinomyces TaxID=1654 RepID=UPI001F47779F|nr:MULTISPECIES: tellurium resistance protein TerC [Actinomyces]